MCLIDLLFFMAAEKIVYATRPKTVFSNSQTSRTRLRLVLEFCQLVQKNSIFRTCYVNNYSGLV